MIGASSGAGAPSTLPESSAFGHPRFSQAIAGSLLFEGSVFSSSLDLGFFLFGEMYRPLNAFHVEFGKMRKSHIEEALRLSAADLWDVI